jgi:hypothetical protein
MSQDIVAFLRRADLPQRKALQAAIDSLGIRCRVDKSFAPSKSSGFLPCVLNGAEAGFEIYFGLTVERVAGSPRLAKKVGDRDVAISLISRGSPEEYACVATVGAALIAEFDGVVCDSDGGIVPRQRLEEEVATVLNGKSRSQVVTKRMFAAAVLRLAPTFRLCDYIFYEPPAEHILCGFAFERLPMEIRVWKYALPLYDRPKFLHLSFAEPLAILDAEETVEECASEFLRRIRPHRAKLELLTKPKNFLENLETTMRRNRRKWGEHRFSPAALRAAALTEIMLGRSRKAASGLQALLDKGDSVASIHTEGLRQLLRELEKSPTAAKAKLLRWESETKRRLGLEVGIAS